MKFQLKMTHFLIFTIFSVFRVPRIFKKNWLVFLAPNFVRMILAFLLSSLKKIRSKFGAQKILWLFEKSVPVSDIAMVPGGFPAKAL